MISYLLLGIHGGFESGKTMNQLLATKVVGDAGFAAGWAMDLCW